MATRFASAAVQDDVELAETQNESTPDAPLNTSGNETVSSAAADKNVVWDDDPSPPSMPDPNGASGAGHHSTDKYAQI